MVLIIPKPFVFVFFNQNIDFIRLNQFPKNASKFIAFYVSL